MDEKTVRSLEKQIEAAVLEAISDIGLKRLPLLPTHQTMHLMAKAAVAVYEAADENYDRGRSSEERAGTNRPCPRATPRTDTVAGQGRNVVPRIVMASQRAVTSPPPGIP